MCKYDVLDIPTTMKWRKAKSKEKVWVANGGVERQAKTYSGSFRWPAGV